MREVVVSSWATDEILAKRIRAKDGSILLEAGTRLTDYYISRLKELGVKTVFVEDRERPERFERPKPERQIPEQEIRKHVYRTLTQLIDSDIIKTRLSAPALEDRFRRIYSNIFHEIASHEPILQHLTALYQTDRYLFEHSVNVTVYSGIIGVAKNYDASQLLDLSIGAILFDIGMTTLPKHLIKNKSRLTDADRKLLENHTKIGYDMLISLPGVSMRSAKCALQHHERYNGTGYPYRLSHREIDEYAQIVAISDTFDALISPRHHRKAHSPTEATEFLFGSGNTHFDLELIQLFLKHITVYPVSSTVVLSSGQVGVVASVDSNFIHRPVVKIVQEADGRKVLAPYEIDLKKNTDLVITGVFSSRS